MSVCVVVVVAVVHWLRQYAHCTPLRALPEHQARSFVCLLLYCCRALPPPSLPSLLGSRRSRLR